MQAEYWALTIVGIPIGILLFFYIFAKAVKMGKPAKKAGMAPTNKENMFVGIYARIKGKIGGVKRPNWSIPWHVIALLIIVGISYGWNVFHTNTYTFTDTANLTNYLQIDSGSPRLENGCLVMSYGDKITIKGSADLNPSNIIITPCSDSAELYDVHIITGNLDASYFKGPKYREGKIVEVSTGLTVYTFFPNEGNIISENSKILTPLVLERGAIAWPNYLIWTGNGIADKIRLANSRESVAQGSGLISIEVKNKEIVKIKEIAVTEGLLVKFL